MKWFFHLSIPIIHRKESFRGIKAKIQLAELSIRVHMSDTKLFKTVLFHWARISCALLFHFQLAPLISQLTVHLVATRIYLPYMATVTHAGKRSCKSHPNTCPFSFRHGDAIQYSNMNRINRCRDLAKSESISTVSTRTYPHKSWSFSRKSLLLIGGPVSLRVCLFSVHGSPTRRKKNKSSIIEVDLINTIFFYHNRISCL